jgi:hypothetical protein
MQSARLTIQCIKGSPYAPLNLPGAYHGASAGRIHGPERRLTRRMHQLWDLMHDDISVKFRPMDTAIIVAVLSFFGSAVLFFLTKSQERRVEWRKQKLEHYKEFMTAANELLKDPRSPTAATRFASAGNNIHLVGSPAVLVSLSSYMDSIAATDGRDRHDELLTDLLRDIRYDMGLEWGLPLAYRMKFRSAGRV